MIAPTVEDVDAFRRAIALRMGLRFDDDGLALLEQLLAARMRATSAPAAADYLERRMPASAEISELSRSLSVVETYFLRNRDQFSALDAILRKRAQAGPKRLRVLSAGCSSGEEPYSIAIMIRETIPDAAQWDIGITAFDINPDGLDRARAGRYRAWSLRETPPEIQRRYYTVKGDEFTLDHSIRSMVRFEQRNIVEPDPGFWRPGQFDIIFCRNILMYFTPQAMREAVERMAGSLAPGGYFFMGHAENLRGVSAGFHLCHTHGTFYYQKRGDGRTEDGEVRESIASQSVSEPLPADVSWFEAIAEASARIRSLADAPPENAVKPPAQPDTPRADMAKAMDLWQRERFGEAQEALSGRANVDPDSLLLRAMLLVSKADSKGALSVCEDLLRLDELNAAAHYVKALCQEHMGNLREAVEHDQTAAYLDPQFAMPHLHLGLIARRGGDNATALRELSTASGLFAREDASRIVLFGGGFGREQLMALCRAEIRAAERAS
ncbi:MAG: protein-glutamate O-methyltransferase [Planctomycetes bacterium]|nr:protein-glutamate O-methyltransferase [Planctomycetota bacterium]